MLFAKGPRAPRGPRPSGADSQSEESAMKHLAVVALALSVAAGARADNPIVLISTSMGDIKVELDPDKAPITVKNFLSYVDDKHYDNTLFHRVISGFMIQGGGYEPGGKEKQRRGPIKNESANGLSNQRGTIAMARTSAPNSATAQFFINVADNLRLDRANSPDRVGYCVFGKVIDGMDVVDEIRKVPTGIKHDMRDAPTKDVVF
jgi:cyclophilin family peptidyl-prolyl cis-trans isomerase